MEALEFLKESKRMCRSFAGSCAGCPWEKIVCETDLDDASDDDYKRIVATVEQWSKEHPRKTRQSVFLKRWPVLTKIRRNFIMNNNQNYIVRCDRAGVFFGKIKERNGQEVTMTEVRKLWSWDGACAVEQLAQDGTKAPGNCRFTVTVPEMIVLGAIQIISCTDTASASLRGVKEWKR